MRGAPMCCLDRPSRPKRSTSAAIASWPRHDDRRQRAEAEGADREEGDGDVEGAENAPDQRPPGRLAGVADAGQAAARERGHEHQRERADEERHRRRLQASDLAPETRVDGRLQADEAAGRDGEQHRQPRGSLGLQPVLPDADVDRQRRLALPHADHLALDQLGR